MSATQVEHRTAQVAPWPQSTQYPPQPGQNMPNQTTESCTYGPGSPIPLAYGNASPGAAMFPGYAGAPDINRSISPEKFQPGMVSGVPGATVVHVVAQPSPNDQNCACSSGWIMFGVGFLVPVTWFVSFFIACFVRNKHNRNAAIASAVVLVVIGTVVGVVVGLYASPGECVDLPIVGTFCYNKYSKMCQVTNMLGKARQYCGDLNFDFVVGELRKNAQAATQMFSASGW